MPVRPYRHEVFIKDLDPAHEGLVIAQLSDVHVGAVTRKQQIFDAVKIANDANPDLIFMTGDYVCRAKKWIEPMAERLGKLSAGRILVTLGNHDYWCDGEGVARALDKKGFDVLRNANTRIDVKGAPLTVVGVDDPVTRHHDLDKSFRGVKQDDTVLCLVHCPEMGPMVAERGAELIVAGHTHGGHLYHPKATPWMAKKITGRNYISGWYDVGHDGQLYVNRGIGSAAFTPRVGEGAKAEVALFTLRRAV